MWEAPVASRSPRVVPCPPWAAAIRRGAAAFAKSVYRAGSDGAPSHIWRARWKHGADAIAQRGALCGSHYVISSKTTVDGGGWCESYSIIAFW